MEQPGKDSLAPQPNEMGQGADREIEGKSRPHTMAHTVAQQDIKSAERNYAVALCTILQHTDQVFSYNNRNHYSNHTC